jgi:hypothetical protein
MRIPLLLAVLLVGATAYASGLAAAPTGWTTEHYLASETWHAFGAFGGTTGGPDDIYASQQTVRTPGGKTVGVVYGYGINLHRPYVYFHWTATLGNGTLTIESAVDLRSRSTVYPIVGGTGRYASARGTVTVTDNGAKGTLVTIRYRR